MAEYKLNHFTMADAQALAGKAADITAWDDDELETKVTYPGAKVTGIIVLVGPYLVIETAGAVITDARTGEQLGTRPPEPELHLLFTWVCEVGGVRGRFERGDRVALEYTDDPDTRLRPGDEGTVTRYDPKLGQFSDRRAPFDSSELEFCVTDMSVTLTSRPAGAADERFGSWDATARSCSGRSGSATGATSVGSAWSSGYRSPPLIALRHRADLW